MKALTLTQPWAQLVAFNAKQIETRSWSTQYRGALAIHAAKGFPKWAKELVFGEPFYSVLRKQFGNYSHLPDFPLGAIVAICELTAVHRIPQSRQHFARFDKYTNFLRFEHYRNHPLASYPITLPPFPDTNEFAFGDYKAGRYAWVLTDIKALTTPIACKGALSLWDVPAEVEVQIREQLHEPTA